MSAAELAQVGILLFGIFCGYKALRHVFCKDACIAEDAMHLYKQGYKNLQTNEDIARAYHPFATFLWLGLTLTALAGLLLLRT